MNAESIEIWINWSNLALHHRAIPIWTGIEVNDREESGLYLKEAYAKNCEKAGKEGTETFGNTMKDIPFIINVRNGWMFFCSC